MQSRLWQPKHWHGQRKLPQGLFDPLCKSCPCLVPHTFSHADGGDTLIFLWLYLGTIWQVIDIVVDVLLWEDVFENIPPKLGQIAQIGTFCRDINMPYTAPDNCETELPFLVVNATNEGYNGYLYLQHTSYFDYAISAGMRLFRAMQGSTQCRVR